jgi:hypothetical protein
VSGALEGGEGVGFGDGDEPAAARAAPALAVDRRTKPSAGAGDDEAVDPVASLDVGPVDAEHQSPSPTELLERLLAFPPGPPGC